MLSMHDACMKWGIRINTGKTKILSIGVEEANILIAGRVLENVSEFCCGQHCDRLGLGLYVRQRLLNVFRKLEEHFVLRNVEFSQIKDLARTQNCKSLDR